MTDHSRPPMWKENTEQLLQNYLGVLRLLAEGAIHYRSDSDGNEMRDLIEEALTDAQKLIPELRWRRVLSSFEIDIAP